jgi:hypothetical protein
MSKSDNYSDGANPRELDSEYPLFDYLVGMDRHEVFYEYIPTSENLRNLIFEYICEDDPDGDNLHDKFCKNMNFATVHLWKADEEEIKKNNDHEYWITDLDFIGGSF